MDFVHLGTTDLTIVFGPGIKTRTRLGCELAVTVNCGAGIPAAQVSHQTVQGAFLCFSAGICGRMAVSLDPSGIGHTDRAGVVAVAMRPGTRLGAPRLNCAVKAYQIVIADSGPTLRTVP